MEIIVGKKTLHVDDKLWRDIVFIVRLKALEKSRCKNRLLTRGPVVPDHLSWFGSSFFCRFNVEESTESLGYKRSSTLSRLERLELSNICWLEVIYCLNS